MAETTFGQRNAEVQMFVFVFVPSLTPGFRLRSRPPTVPFPAAVCASILECDELFSQPKVSKRRVT